MTVKQFYENIHGDYEDVLARFSSDALVVYFVKQFVSDSSYRELMEAVERRDPKASFAAAHKLKGIAANLSFSDLHTQLHTLCEQLRPQTELADAALVQKIRENCRCILREISCLEDEDGV